MTEVANDKHRNITFRCDKSSPMVKDIRKRLLLEFFYKTVVLKNFSDKFSVKKIFLVVDRVVKVTCFILINISCKKSVAGLMSCSVLKNNLRHMFLVLIFFV